MKENRVYGLDLLRILCMLFIVTLHYMGVGGAFFNIEVDVKNNFTANFALASLIEAFATVAVNCFIMITGYLLSESKFNKNKFINYILMTLFYSYIISAICFFINPNLLTSRNLIYTLLPISFSKYWFITTYLALYLLFPYINKLINSMNRKEFNYLLIILIMIFSVWHTINPFAETLDSNKGYSIIWFTVLYLIGAYIKKYNIKLRNSKMAFLLYVFSTFIICISKLSCIMLSEYFPFLLNAQNLLYHYNSLITLSSSIALFLCFSNMDITKLPKFILKTSSLTLGVYLIHDHFLFRDILWIKIIPVCKFFQQNWFFIITPLIVLSVFSICIICEYFRVQLFKILRVQKVK